MGGCIVIVPQPKLQLVKFLTNYIVVGCTVSPTVESRTPPYEFNTWGNRFGTDRLFTDECEPFGNEPEGYYVTDDGIKNAFILIDTGCKNANIESIELKNTHNDRHNE